MKKDFLGTEVKVGDTVIFIGDQRELKIGVITKLNKCKASLVARHKFISIEDIPYYREYSNIIKSNKS